MELLELTGKSCKSVVCEAILGEVYSNSVLLVLGETSWNPSFNNAFYTNNSNISEIVEFMHEQLRKSDNFNYFVIYTNRDTDFCKDLYSALTQYCNSHETKVIVIFAHK